MNISGLDKLIVIGDRVLIRPINETGRTKTGLYLPPGVEEKEKIRTGYVIKVGPGYPIPLPVEGQPWKDPEETIQYIPLQIKAGDLAIFLQRDAHEVHYQEETFFIVSQSSILMVERDETLFE